MTKNRLEIIGLGDRRMHRMIGTLTAFRQNDQMPVQMP